VGYLVSDYILSYTAASLSLNEIETIANLYATTQNWDEVKHQVVEENILQKGAISARKREFVELKKRVDILTEAQLTLLSDATSSELKHLAILSCFKVYKFIYDFATEVMRDKMLLFDFQILDSDYESFYDSKSATYENLNTISQKTQNKLKQVMFKIFEQAEFLDSTKTKNIQKPYLSDRLIELIVQDNPKYLCAFLYSNNDINHQIKRFT